MTAITGLKNCVEALLTEAAGPEVTFEIATRSRQDPDEIATEIEHEIQ